MARQPIKNSDASLYLDGNAGYLTLPITPSPTGFNFGLWIKTGKRTASSSSIYMSSTSAAFTDGFILNRVIGRGDIEFVGYNSTNTVNTSLRSGQVSDGRWVHLVVTYLPSGVCNMYQDGVLANTVTATNTITTGTTSIFVGKRSYNATYAGLNANQLVWHNTTTPWTAAQVMDLYQLGAIPAGATGVYPLNEGAGSIAYDKSGNANNGTITSGSWSREAPSKTRKGVNGNMVYNGDFEIAPVVNVPQTTAFKWLDGTAAGAANGGTSSRSIAIDRTFGIYFWDEAGQGSIMLDSTEKKSGNYSLKVSTLATASSATAGMGDFNLLDYMPVLPSTSYTYSYWMKTNVVSGSATSGARMSIKETNGARSTTTTTLPTGVKTTTDWTQYTGTVTTGATTRFIFLLPNIIGSDGAGTLIMDAWFDDITLTPTTAVTRSASTAPPRRDVNNLVYNGGFEYAPAFTAATTTNTRWIDGTAGGSSSSQSPYGWRTAINAGTFSAKYDDAVSKNGLYSLKLTTSAGGWTDIVTGYSTMKPTLIPVLPSTSYTLSGWIKTEYLSGDCSTGARLFVNTYTGAGTYISTPGATTPIKTTTDWTYYSHTFTTSSDARFATVPVSIRGNDGAATLAMTAWFDDVSLKLTTLAGRSAA